MKVLILTLCILFTQIDNTRSIWLCGDEYEYRVTQGSIVVYTTTIDQERVDFLLGK